MFHLIFNYYAMQAYFVGIMALKLFLRGTDLDYVGLTALAIYAIGSIVYVGLRRFRDFSNRSVWRVAAATVFSTIGLAILLQFGPTEAVYVTSRLMLYLAVGMVVSPYVAFVALHIEERERPMSQS